ncbi:putative sulfate exporter family transporter [Yimella sp. cx-573]|nr:putative sulfate exporter family transporter [Yimella sp. cx-573]
MSDSGQPVRASRRITPIGLAGLGITLAVAGVAMPLGSRLPLVGGPVFAVLIGCAIATLVPASRSGALTAGYAIAARTVLQASVVLLGTGLSLSAVIEVGVSSVPVMLGTLVVALLGARWIGRWLGVDPQVRTLIGVGTGICGASAIAAVAAVCKPKNSDVAYALGTIFTFNVAAVLTFPMLGHVIGMSGESFGLWSGTAINDTSSVVAAAYSFGDGAGEHAIVVKLTRALMIIPVTVALAVLLARRGGSAGTALPWRRSVPGFLIGFLVAAALNTIGAVPSGWHGALSLLASFLICVAMGGIGLLIRPAELRATGHRPILLGGVLWVLVAVSSLVFQTMTGTLR